MVLFAAVRISYHLCKKLHQMVTITQDKVETEIIKAVEDLNKNLKIGATVDATCSPGNVGFASQVLLTIMSTLEINLGVNIPHNVYIFHDKDTFRQLTISEAAKKLIKLAKHGN